MSTGEPGATEIGQAGFRGGPTEKALPSSDLAGGLPDLTSGSVGDGGCDSRRLPGIGPSSGEAGVLYRYRACSAAGIRLRPSGKHIMQMADSAPGRYRNVRRGAPIAASGRTAQTGKRLPASPLAFRLMYDYELRSPESCSRRGPDQ